MKTKAFLFAILSLCACMAGAQTFQNETIKERASFSSYDADMGETMYYTNDLDLKLPVSCSDQSVNVSAIRTTLLKSIFNSHYSQFSSTQLIRQNVRKVVLMDGIGSNKWKPCATVSDDSYGENYISESIIVEQVSIYKGNVFFLVSAYDYGGGAHGMSIQYGVGIDIHTGAEVKIGNFFNLAKQKSIIRMLTTAAGVKKYMVDGKDWTLSDCKEIASGVKETLSGSFTFPAFYISSDSKLHLLYQPYDLGPYALGAPEFTIPMSAIGAASTSTASKTRTTTTKKTTSSRKR